LKVDEHKTHTKRTQNDIFQPKEISMTSLPAHSFLDLITTQQPLHLPHGPLSGAYLSADGAPVIEMALENGNSATRVMTLHATTHTPVITQTPSLYEEETTPLIYATDTGEWWQVEERDGSRSPRFHIGSFADAQASLPIGKTDVRWNDHRFVNFNRACLVSTLIQAGYGPGTHFIGICPGCRNEEVIVGQGVSPQVQAALSTGLQSFVLWYKDTDRYDIRIHEILPAVPQTFGSHFAFDSDIFGRSLHPEVPQWVWFDIGFYDAHIVTVRRRNASLQVTGTKIADGMASVVRDMGIFLRQAHFSQMEPLSYGSALEMMRRGQVYIGGLPLEGAEQEKGKQLIAAYKDREGGNLIRTLLAHHPTLDAVFAFTGGGSIDLAHQIRRQTQHHPPHLIKCLAEDVARIANIAGIFLLLNLAKRKQSRRGILA